MARRKINNVNRDSEFYECMFDMRLDVSQADAVVKLLEGIPADDMISFTRDFCISYVIKFLETYCKNDDDCELALASYGFLDGFSYIKYKSVQVRVGLYWKYASQYDCHEFIKASWTPESAVSILKDEHIAIIGYLDKITSNIKSKNDGKLGLIEEVPKKLEFPKPRGIEEVVSISDDCILHPSLDSETELKQPGDENETNSENRAFGNPPPEDIIPDSDPADSPTDGDTAGQNKDLITPVRVKIPWWLKLPIILASIVAVLLISVLSILIYQYKVTPPEIEEITAKTNILVSPGDKQDLELDVYPDSADWERLGSKIGNEELVGITNDWWVFGLDGLGDKDSDNTAIVIWGGKAEPALITVTVAKSGNRGED